MNLTINNNVSKDIYYSNHKALEQPYSLPCLYDIAEVEIIKTFKQKMPRAFAIPSMSGVKMSCSEENNIFNLSEHFFNI